MNDDDTENQGVEDIAASLFAPDKKHMVPACQPHHRALFSEPTEVDRVFATAGRLKAVLCWTSALATLAVFFLVLLHAHR
jgi:hypothetical protein